MEILDIVNQATGQVVFNVINNHGGTDVDQLDVSEVVLIVSKRLVDFFIIADTISEVLCSDLRVLSHIIWRRSLDLENIVHNKFLVIAFRLNKQGLDSVGKTVFVDPITAILGGVCGIQDRNLPISLTEPASHVCHGCLSSSAA